MTISRVWFCALLQVEVARVLSEAGKHDEARTTLAAVLERGVKALGPDNSVVRKAIAFGQSLSRPSTRESANYAHRRVARVCFLANVCFLAESK